MSARISANAGWLTWAVAGGVTAIFLFSSIVSFAGLYSIAGWLGLPQYIWWSFPLAVDLAIVVYKVAEIILRSDHTKASKVKKAVFGTILFTAVSSLGNIVHVAYINDPDPLKYYGGMVGAGLMPWAVYLAASVLTDLVVNLRPDLAISRAELDAWMDLEDDLASAPPPDNAQEPGGVDEIEAIAYGLEFPQPVENPVDEKVHRPIRRVIDFDEVERNADRANRQG